tara:strand:+ start:208 stop:894 length:687 start_codon:yes stop_codon:yes gene_type:complete
MRKRKKTHKKRGGFSDGFESEFKELLRKIEWAKNEEEIRQALIVNIKNFIIYDIKNKGKLITGNVKTFSIKKSHKTNEWKNSHKTLSSKIKALGSGSTPSTQIYFQWWRYILKKCKKEIKKRVPIAGYRLQQGSHCEAWGDAGKKLFKMIDIEYIQGSENVPHDSLNTKKFVKGENSIVHQAKELAFEEISNNPDIIKPNVSKGGRKRKKRKRKTRRKTRRKKRTRRR